METMASRELDLRRRQVSPKPSQSQSRALLSILSDLLLVFPFPKVSVLRATFAMDCCSDPGREVNLRRTVSEAEEDRR